MKACAYRNNQTEAKKEKLPVQDSENDTILVEEDNTIYEVDKNCVRQKGMHIRK